MKHLLRFKTFLLMAIFSLLAGTSAWAQSDFSSTETSNVTLIKGTNASDCTVNGKDGIKVGTSSKGGDMSVTVPAGTKYLHLHAAAWKGVNSLSLNISEATVSPASISLSPDAGVSNNSPFTLSGDASDFYFVIELSNITTETTLKFTTSTTKRFVIWGVNAEEESGTGGDTSVATTVTIDASGIKNTDVYAGTDAGSLTATVSTDEGAISGAIVTWSGNNDAVATIDASTGAVTLVAAGSVTFTASYAGAEDTYKPSSKTYVMTVTNNDPTIPGTENNPYTVAQARAAIDASTGVNGVYATGIVSEIITAYGYNNYSNITFNIVTQDGDSEFLQAFRCVSSTNADASTIAVGDIVVVSGNLTKYNTTYEFAQGCQVVSITHPVVAVATPTFDPVAGAYSEPQNVTISCATDGADIYYTTDGTEPDANSTPFTGAINVATTTTIKAIAYKGGESSAVAKGTYHITSVDNPYTVSQALGFDDSEYPIEQIYVHGIVSTAPTQAPTNYGQLTYYISDDGTTTNQLQVYKGQGLNAVEFTSQDDIQVGDEVTIIGNVKIYNNAKEFDTGNYLVAFNRPVVATPSITITPDTYEMDAKAGGGVLPVVCENLASDPELAVVFVEADGTTPATYDWIQATINANGNIEGQITANDTGAARTAYFKVHGVDADNNDVYSNLVTFTQEAPVAATPTIVFNPESIDFDANSGYRTIGGDYFQLKDFDSTPSLEILYYESDGDTEKQGGYDWLTADFNSNNQIDFAWNTNMGAARTAYLKIHAVGTTVYSNLFTVNQAAAATPDVAHYYQKVSSSADLTNGDYLIVNEEGNVAFNGGLETLDAVNNTIEVKIADDKIASSETVDAAVFTIDTTAGTLLSASGLYIGQTTDGNGMKSSAETPYENTLQVDTDGNADIASAGAYLRYNAASNQERFRYYKSSSYTGQKVIQLYKRMDGEMPAASPALAVTPDVVTVPYTGGAESFTVTPSNVENAFGGYVTFYDPTDTETTVDQPDWIGISYDYSNMSLSYTITDENNTGAERTACFKYFIKCDNGEAMSNLVTVKQEAYVAPVASIAVDPNVVNATFAATDGTIAVTYNNITTVVSEVKFYDADGTTEATYDWIEAEINADNNVYYVIGENSGVARTAYLKVYALDDDANDVYSELITINQAAYVAPALTQINLTKTLVFDTDCGLASGGYAVNDELTELSGTFEGDASATRFGGFVIKDSYINGGSIQMKANTGSIAFPSIESEYGFDVTVAYKTNDAIVYINGESSTEASSGTAYLIIATGSKYCQITSITLTPKTGEVTPPVDVDEPTITEADGLVEIIAGSDNAQVIYTTDGTNPTYEPLNGTVYTAPFNITVDTTIKAIGVDADGNASDVVEVAVTAPVVSGVKYYKVTSTDQLEEGVDYLLVYEGEAGEGAAAYGGLNSYTGYSIGKSVALKHIGGSVVTITDEEVVPVTLKSRSEDGTKWAMRDATGWIAAVNGYNNLHGDKTEDDAIWTFDFTADANKQIFQEFTATSTRYLQYNTSSPRFAGYTGTQSAVYLYKAATYNVSVGATGYATLYYGTKNLVVPENVEAYTYTVKNGKLEESYLYSTNEVIPAGTGVVLKAPAGEYKFAVTTEAGLEDTDNLLFGFDEPSTTVAPAAGDYLFYLLGVDNGKVGFYWGKADGAAFKSGAHKAYLAVPTEVAAGVRGFTFDGTTVGINTIGVDMPEGNAYDLQGRRVQQLQKNGLYIVDGKKMLAK